MKIFTINGIDFEMQNNSITDTIFTNLLYGKHCDLFDYYERPSQTKINIWDSWVEWFCQTDGILSWSVCGANSNQFSIEATYQDINGDCYKLYITKAHNRIYRVA